MPAWEYCHSASLFYIHSVYWTTVLHVFFRAKWMKLWKVNSGCVLKAGYGRKSKLVIVKGCMWLSKVKLGVHWWKDEILNGEWRLSTNRQTVTLLHMPELYIATRMSGRSSSLQPLLSNSLALNLYFPCPLRKHTDAHIMPRVKTETEIGSWSPGRVAQFQTVYSR